MGLAVGEEWWWWREAEEREKKRIRKRRERKKRVDMVMRIKVDDFFDKKVKMGFVGFL